MFHLIDAGHRQLDPLRPEEVPVETFEGDGISRHGLDAKLVLEGRRAGRNYLRGYGSPAAVGLFLGLAFAYSEIGMSGFWRAWFALWCLSLGVFGLVLSGGGIEATSGPVNLILTTLQGGEPITFDAPLRFSLAVLGAVSLGWAVTLYFVIGAAIELKERGRPLWNAITAGMVTWFVVDSALSVATGFGLNVVPNVLLAALYLIGLVGSGALKRSA